MFTGIITDVVPVIKTTKEKGGVTLTFQKPASWTDLELGESVATNGVCLTVAAIRDQEYDSFAMPETLNISAFGAGIPNRVNLERSLSAKDRFGGHFVQGHVDGVGDVVKVEPGEDYRLSISFLPQNDPLVMYKGSITINGASLTVAETKDSVLTVALIPHTLEHTTLGDLKTGDKVNLEFDMIGKYIANILEKQSNAKS
jgi:riboflavin synthase